jgi:hypothetical protein
LSNHAWHHQQGPEFARLLVGIGPNQIDAAVQIDVDGKQATEIDVTEVSIDRPVGDVREAPAAVILQDLQLPASSRSTCTGCGAHFG